MKLLSTIVVLLLVCAVSAFPTWEKHILVDGKLTCGENALEKYDKDSPLKIELLEYDSFTNDDYIGKAETRDNKGRFSIRGSRYELFGLKPYIQITGGTDQCTKIVSPRLLRRITLAKHSNSGYCNDDKNFKYYNINVDLETGVITYNQNVRCPE